MSINTITLSGYVCNIKQPNEKITTFGIGHTRYDYSKKEKVREFTNCKLFGKTKDFFDKYVKDKQFIVISGALEYSTYEKNGTKVTTSYVSVSEIDMPTSKVQDSEDVPF